jgi:hypothetical protein
MQEEQRDLERGKTLPDFLLVENSPIALTAGVGLWPLPTNFLRRSNQLIRYYIGPTGLVLGTTIPWREFDAAFDTFESADPAPPVVAVLQFANILFVPTPQEDTSLIWTYYRKADVLTADIENLWLQYAPELIIGGAGLRIAKDKRDANAIALFGDMYKQARSTWFAETITQETEDGPMCLGSNA